MKIMLKKYFILTLVLAFALLGSSVHAQVRDTDLVLEISPENPNPNQNVTAKLASYVTDLSKAYIVWSLNSEKSAGGVGKTSFSFNTGDLATIELTATIETIDGASIVKTINITPVAVDMLWEAVDAYAPPFYRGKTLVPSEGSFKVVAMPNISTGGSNGNPNNFSYTWDKDGKAQPSSSGWGDSSFIFKTSYLDRSNNVNVKVSDISGNTNAEGRINLSTAVPKILFYEKDPVFGIKMQSSLENNFQTSKDGTVIIAIPYFISPKKLSSNDLNFSWYINNIQVSTKEPKNEIGLKPEKKENGTASIKLVVSNNGALFTGVKKEIRINF